MLTPKKVKHRKQQKGRLRGVATSGTGVAFGNFGLQALEAGFLTTRQIESAEHDTQVATWEAVGHPVWIDSPMTDVLRRCDMGGRVQRTHHWSPLLYDVDFVTTARDKALRIYEFPKDRHVFPWIEVNARFGLIERKTPRRVR